MGCLFSIVFPRPPSDYDEGDSRILRVGRVPTLFYKKDSLANRLVIYFHGNAEDADIAGEYVEYFMNALNAHGVAVEYPTYGVYHDQPIKEETFFEDAIEVYRFYKDRLKLDDQQIIIVGRSIGSGPSTDLASKVSCGGFVLVSPLKSLDHVMCDKLGLFCKCLGPTALICLGIGLLMAWLFDVRWVLKTVLAIVSAVLVFLMVLYCSLWKFRNITKIGKVTSPTLIIHGDNDEVIHHSHGMQLYEECMIQQKQLEVRRGMTHNFIHKDNDIINPVKTFFDPVFRNTRKEFKAIDISKLNLKQI